MKGLLYTTQSRFRLFKQPHKIGDTVNVKGKPYLVIAIERFSIFTNTLTVWYTTQDLSQSDYVYHKQHGGWNTKECELEFSMKYDDDRWKDVHLGSTFFARDQNMYKLLEFTEISFKGTDLYISVIGKRVHPINHKEARAKFMQERKKMLKLEIH